MKWTPAIVVRPSTLFLVHIVEKRPAIFTMQIVTLTPWPVTEAHCINYILQRLLTGLVQASTAPTPPFVLLFRSEI